MLVHPSRHSVNTKDSQQITFVAIQSLKKCVFPIIPWKTWTLPRSQGGPSILDVNLQHAALYFRWIFPLFHLDSLSFTNNPLLTTLIYRINNQNCSSCHQLPLLFPVTRQQFTKTRRVNTIDMMYKSIDMLPRNFDKVAINLPLFSCYHYQPSSWFGVSFGDPNKVELRCHKVTVQQEWGIIKSSKHLLQATCR
ncbi:hypothetical protein MAM1_0256d08815 [Mucor ambiguus]|uniref:Uncharacterized protein n=1 Tax=Mucor ambiguus TaxID=91626 RepID=A0A0C9LWX6_9FUNG|nr:hypothetical protein MAM1_0256d08815 [Mucor ambiguus]